MFNKKALLNMVIRTLLIMVFVHPLIFYAGQQTSAGNVAILGRTEALFTFLVFGLLRIEKVEKQRVIGATLIGIGAAAIMLKDFSFDLQKWDLLIVLAAAIAPFGNVFQKKVVAIISPVTYLCFRNLVGGSIVLFMSSSLEIIPLEKVVSGKAIFLIIMIAMISFGALKLLIFYAMQKIDVSKIVALSMVRVAISLVFAYIFLSEMPNAYQILGFFIMLFGIYCITKKKIDKI
jgi:drug/metabolite transporter (DMT)-like permease